jgi:signal transduction histidine kinase
MEVFTVVKRNPFVIPLAFVVALVMVFISEGSYWRSVDTLDELGATATARLDILRLERGILDAETGQRGYLLTGSNDYLAPYQAATQRIVQAFSALELHYGKQPESAAALGQLRALIDTKLSELAVTITLYDQGRREASNALLLSGIGMEKMADIRTLIAKLLDAETKNVVEGRQDVYRTLLLSRIGVTLLSAISLLALVMYLRESFALEREQRQQKSLIEAQRDQLENEVVERTAQLVELTHHLQTAREDERGRLARDLHDELGALLTSAKLDAARIKSRLGSSAPEASERLVHLVKTLNSGIELKRRIVEDLRPSSLTQLGLPVTLEILAREFEERSGIKVERHFESVKLGASAELVVYRLVQEAITNITKYAKAEHVWTRVNERAGWVEVTVRDDGVGFDTSVPPSSAYGLLGMRYRVKAEGGSMQIVSSPGEGTLIEARLPLG